MNCILASHQSRFFNAKVSLTLYFSSPGDSGKVVQGIQDLCKNLPQNFVFDRLSLFYWSNEIAIEDIYLALTRCKHLIVHGSKMVNQEAEEVDDVVPYRAESVLL